MKNIRLQATLGVLISMLIAGVSSAALIDFESTGVGDNSSLTGPISGVHFLYDGDLDGLPDTSGGSLVYMQIEAAGDADLSPQGFQYDQDPAKPKDVEHPDNAGELGNWLLRSPGEIIGRPPSAMIIRYDTPTTAFSGQIWDIDGGGVDLSEKWTVEVYAAQGDDSSKIVEFDSPEGTTNTAGSLDGKPWNFAYQASLQTTVSEVRIVFSGTKESTIGLAFDNFNSTAIPEPASMGILAMGGLALALRRRR